MLGTIEADYLVVGAGAAGMAFADSLVSESEANIVIVDRRHAPGGHWNDAYPFVRLHQPAMYYGVNSMPLGSDTIDQRGLNGSYRRAHPRSARTTTASWASVSSARAGFATYRCTSIWVEGVSSRG